MLITAKAFLISLALAAQAPSAEEDVPEQEFPIWLEVGPQSISARVRSNGCTKKEDFRVKIHRLDGSVRVVFWRQKPDPCRAYIRDGVVLRWSRAELGLTPADSVNVTFARGY